MPLVLHFLLALKIARPCQLDRYSAWITETYGMIKYLIVITEAITLLMSQKKPEDHGVNPAALVIFQK